MSNGGPTTEARNALNSLFKRMGVERLVCVDDEHASALTLEGILAWFESATVDELAIAFPEFEGRSVSDIDVRKEAFRQWWNGLPSTQREEYSNQARPLVQADARAESPDVDFMSALSEVCEGMTDVTFIALAPDEWTEQSESLLADPDCAKTLFLFDQDMSKGGGRTNEGSALIGSMIAKFAGAETRPFCGILTHTTRSENQVARWEELAAEAGVDRDLFMVIPKSLLTDDLQEFTRQIKAAVLTPSFRKLKDLSSTILSKSLQKATQELDRLTVLDFDHMVMRVARGEGVWEGQVLFRLHGLFHRIEAEQRARQDAGLADLIAQIRKVSHIPEMGKSHASTVVRGIRHAETYEEGTSVNKAHLDVTTGDIFEVTTPQDGEKSRMMVVTQPCDLAMRPDGNRKARYALLLSIVPVTRAGVKQARYVELPYFHKDDSNDNMAVDFLSPSISPCWVLDTCVLDDEGRCGLRLDTEAPQGFLPCWGKHFAEVLGEARRLHEQCDVSCVAEEKDRKAILVRLAPFITSCGTVKASVEGNEVRIPLRRTMRLGIAVAMDVVRQYAAYMARTPHDVDLAREA